MTYCDIIAEAPYFIQRPAPVQVALVGGDLGLVCRPGGDPEPTRPALQLHLVPEGRPQGPGVPNMLTMVRWSVCCSVSALAPELISTVYPDRDAPVVPLGATGRPEGGGHFSLLFY